MSEARLDTLRCADQDRELVAQVLNSAYSEGRLTFEEHSDRIAQAYDAKTFGDLDALTNDLIATPQAARPAVPQAQPVIPPTPVTPGAFRGGNAIFSTLRPGFTPMLDSAVTINAWFGEIRLDLVGTQFISPETTIHLGGLCCEVKIRVPEGVAVEASALNTIIGETKVDGTVPGSALVRLVGTVMLGEVLVLGPATAKHRKYRKFA